jgi:LysM repeat protein
MESSTTNDRGKASIGRWIARLLAILAVGGAALALYLVITGSDTSDDGDKGKRAGQEAPKEQKEEESKPEEEDEPPKTYVVQPGDTIDGIAAQFGVTPEKIQELNPEIDPQALPSGATLKLR